MTSAQNLPGKFLKSAGYTAKRMTSKLRRDAYHSGWPTEVSRLLTVRHDGGDNFYVDYPKQLENNVLNLEYGTQDNPPNAAMLRFMNRSEPFMDDYANKVFDSFAEMDIWK